MSEKGKLTAKEIALAGMMIAVIEVCKVALAAIPNIELTSFWLIMFTLFFGKRTAWVVPAFILLEGAVYGFGIWWITYLYAWPLLVLLTWIFRRQKSVLFWAIFSGIFGLSFGILNSIPYFFIGAAGGGVSAGLKNAFAWVVAGIPFDLMHCVGNFVIMLLLFVPIRSVMRRVNFVKTQ